MHKLLAILIVTASSGCHSGRTNGEQVDDLPILSTEYASKFRYANGGIVVTEPWPGAVKPLKYGLSPIPKRVVVTSTTHLTYLEMLGAEGSIVGFPNTQYISSPKIRNLVEQGKITDLGPSGSINLELLISLRPDLIFVFDMGTEAAALDKIEEAGIPVVYNADYLETSALGRAEWIKFFGGFFNKEALADSIFNGVRSRYDSLKTLAGSVSKRPTILSGTMYGGTWYLPGGQNWAAGLYKDAGGNYLWEGDPANGWLEISFESVFDKAREADFWIGTGSFNSLGEIAGQDKRYTGFGAYHRRNIYNYNKKIGPGGGYDFFESGYARPDIVLADLIKIMRPELLPGYETYYFQQLQ